MSDVPNRLMVEPICYTSNWFQLIYLIDVKYKELLFVLVVSGDLKMGQEVFPGLYSDRMICSQKVCCGLTETLIVVV